ncbi:glutathione S-transferase family protein [Rubrivivax benzoatilyticus]|uniref:Glutathione S-transferase family protein n=1 Tax=Rubrivivax benzoatilyticus TaxID=316997 RepID=A0ABX0HWH9_9BURK|nr:glutathione S-transferase family protein [Rubrivivax benzoatilyticus]EGJ12207.1 glutathione S-transferase domain-containing protein [Rubrivivax benzoatilyticus JA2 = ATCC BAA-35]MCD0423276.1 glutathione S-transferase family protein [Rubrivivax sp. JA1024]NHK99352.1 glutathione S-transferase family protein [Rubrivivax benzoatilyticus]NHL25226.1 glutathione S-transferase family protein [Rubrivivax benzoatilyticus]
MSLQLVIGNKNYSSWSMRPWVLMRQLGIVFDERKLRFDFAEGSDFRRQVAAVSPAGLVPVLLDDGFAVWDTLAITEYLAERFPQAGVWPADARQRARARSLCAEMHGGFGALRRHCAMNIEAALPDVGERLWAEQPALQRDVARLEAMWAEALDASGGPFLFGEFGAADAFYAPVCTRLVSYALPVSDATRAYVRRVLAAPGVAAWIADALAEADFIADEEPYRSSR